MGEGGGRRTRLFARLSQLGNSKSTVAVPVAETHQMTDQVSRQVSHQEAHQKAHQKSLPASARVSTVAVEASPEFSVGAVPSADLQTAAGGKARDRRSGVTEITDADYRCVWRPCPALEDEEETGAW